MHIIVLCNERKRVSVCVCVCGSVCVCVRALTPVVSVRLLRFYPEKGFL